MPFFLFFLGSPQQRPPVWLQVSQGKYRKRRYWGRSPPCRVCQKIEGKKLEKRGQWIGRPENHEKGPRGEKRRWSFSSLVSSASFPSPVCDSDKHEWIKKDGVHGLTNQDTGSQPKSPASTYKGCTSGSRPNEKVRTEKESYAFLKFDDGHAPSPFRFSFHHSRFFRSPLFLVNVL